MLKKNYPSVEDLLETLEEAISGKEILSKVDKSRCSVYKEIKRLLKMDMIERIEWKKKGGRYIFVAYQKKV